MSESTSSGMGLRETKKNALSPGSQTKRSSPSDVLPLEMPPLWCGPPCILECSLLQALSIDRLSLMDVLTLARFRFLFLFSLTAKAAALSKHSGFIITSSLFPKPVREPHTSAACPHFRRGRCWDQKLNTTSLVKRAHGGLWSGYACVK
ncbi:hypothetical protein GOODEAATRI_009929 [Goodea atripinnis]|uniref:Uncharacterized protein n=1 Tax=Goodea atripinnis TaxID=208336 RepID=A0ABV0MGI5_9TELE